MNEMDFNLHATKAVLIFEGCFNISWQFIAAVYKRALWYFKYKKRGTSICTFFLFLL
jgi:hypothetical protein